VLFDWDEGKNELNQRNHDGISFELASRVFEDADCLIYQDRPDEETGELRWHALGRIGSLAVYLVVHVYREQINGKEIIRILSARTAEKHEVRRYLEQAAD
jgi:uncharacterized DUF497 family protein